MYLQQQQMQQEQIRPVQEEGQEVEQAAPT